MAAHPSPNSGMAMYPMSCAMPMQPMPMSSGPMQPGYYMWVPVGPAPHLAQPSSAYGQVATAAAALADVPFKSSTFTPKSRLSSLATRMTGSTVKVWYSIVAWKNGYQATVNFGWNQETGQVCATEKEAEHSAAAAAIEALRQAALRPKSNLKALLCKDFHGRCTKDGCPFFHAHVTWSPVSPLSLSAQQVQRKHQAQLAVGDPVVISDPKYVSDGLTTGRFVAVDFGASEPLLKVDFGDHCGYLHPQFVRKEKSTAESIDEDPAVDVADMSADMPTMDMLDTGLSQKLSHSSKKSANKIPHRNRDTLSGSVKGISEEMENTMDAPPGLILEAEPYRTPSELLVAEADGTQVELLPQTDDIAPPTPLSWSVDEVARWMVSLEPTLARCEPQLRGDLIGGHALSLLSQEDLLELGVPEDLCEAIFTEIQKLFP